MSQEKAKPSGAVSGTQDGKITGLKLVTLAPSTERASEPPPVVESSAVGRDPSVPPPAELPTMRDPYLGCTIDNRYKVEGILGEGGMGVVYECRHKIIGKKVAMKILRADLARDKEVTERFLIEARAASSIGDEHIIDISDFGQLPDGSAYFVMEFLEGGPLSSQVGEGQTLQTERILDIALQLASGLSAAHAANIVHRDLKPDNIFLVKKAGTEDFVKILDFGIAKVTSGVTSKLTQAGSVFGTPHYMAPEQAAGAQVDLRGDIYSFGVILYELACGRVPFDADNFMAILTQHMYKAPTPVREMTPAGKDVSPGLEAIILKCMSKRAEDRYQTMEELAADLLRLRDGEIPHSVKEMMGRSGSFSVPDGFFEPQPSQEADVEVTKPAGVPRGRGPMPFIIGGIAVVAVGVAAFAFAGGKTEESTATEPPVAAEPPPTAAAEAPAPVEAAPAPEPEPATPTPVVVGVSPMSAHVYVNDKDLGASPVVVNVPDGDTVNISVRHAGYKSHEAKLDGTKSKLSVTLEPIKKARAPEAPRPAVRATPPPPRHRPKKKPNTQIGGGEIVNPWAN